jgi:excisionase family DNA binding protein
MVCIANEKFMTPVEVARLFGKKESTVVQWIRAGRLEAKKAGGSLLIKEADLLAMLEGGE